MTALTTLRLSLSTDFGNVKLSVRAVASEASSGISANFCQLWDFFFVTPRSASFNGSSAELFSEGRPVLARSPLPSFQSEAPAALRSALSRLSVAHSTKWQSLLTMFSIGRTPSVAFERWFENVDSEKY
jgi:hypothetical protein